MLEWMDGEGDRLRIAFTKVFGSKVRAFGSQALQRGGVTDGREGVQWQVGYDPRDGRQWVGVNLEGMQYDDWPITRLIQSELREISLPALVKSDPALADVQVLWRRDYWQANGRPGIQERNIAPTPSPLGDLTRDGWHEALTSARDCLDGGRKRLGRALQTVTLPDGKQVEGLVSPHLTFRHVAGERTEWEPFLRAARERMQPLYDWSRRRADKPIRF